MTEAFIVVMYLATIMGMCAFLAFVCKVGDLGFFIFGWIDNKIQQRQRVVVVRPEDFPHAYGRPGVAKSSVIHNRG